MRVLEVLPTYPGEQFDGSAVYERNLNRALRARGVEIEVLTTSAQRLRHDLMYSIAWPDELPERDEHEGVPIRRFTALDTSAIGRLASDLVARRETREDFQEGVVVPGSAGFAEAAVARARSRPGRFDLLADLGRGPVVPGLVAHLARRARRFDAILAGYAPFSLPRQVLWAARRSGVPVVLLPFIHENDRYHQFGSLLRTYEEAAAVFTLSPHTSEFLRRLAPAARPVTLGAGVTVGGERAADTRAFRARHQLGDERLILYVGRKEHSKGYELAIEAVEQLHGTATLVLVGRDADRKPIASEHVRYLGPLSDEELDIAYEACEVFVLPSMFESFGMVFLDAWSRGKPVIGNRICGAAASLIDHGGDGYLCSDAREMAVALRRLLEQPELASRLGAAGRAKVLAEYTWDRVADRAIAGFEAVIADRANAGRRPSIGAQTPASA